MLSQHINRCYYHENDNPMIGFPTAANDVSAAIYNNILAFVQTTLQMILVVVDALMQHHRQTKKRKMHLIYHYIHYQHY